MPNTLGVAEGRSMEYWTDEDYAYWSSRTNFSGDFKVSDPKDAGCWVCLDADLGLIDEHGGLAARFMPALEVIGASPYRPTSVADRYWRVSSVAVQMGLDAAWDDTPWGFAGTYFTDARRYLKRFLRQEAKRDRLRIERDSLLREGREDDAAAQSVLRHVFAADEARQSAMACLASLQGSLDAAYFEFCDILQLPTGLADWIAHASFDQKWLLLASEARVPAPQRDEHFKACKAMLQRRNEFVHTPPRLKRKTTPDTWFNDLVPSGELLQSWTLAVSAHVRVYGEALGCTIEFPYVDPHA